MDSTQYAYRVEISKKKILNLLSQKSIIEVLIIDSIILYPISYLFLNYACMLSENTCVCDSFFLISFIIFKSKFYLI